MVSLRAKSETTGHKASRSLLASRRRPGHEASEAPPKVLVDNQLSDDYTVVEVKCRDRVGLLYLITTTMAALGLDLASARIATEIDKALDTFYVHDAKGQKIEDPEAIERLRTALGEALARPL